MENICKDIDSFKNIKRLLDKFYIEPDKVYIFEGHSDSSWERLALINHPKRVHDRKSAPLIITSINDVNELIIKSKTLVNEKDKKHYLILFRVNLDNNKELLRLPIFSRKNVSFTTFDLRDHILTDDNIEPLRGVTIPSPMKFSAVPSDPNNKRTYLVSFKGKCNNNGWFGCANVRQQLRALSRSYNRNTTGSQYKYIFEDTSDENINTDINLYNSILLNSTYGLVLHGDGRWSHRLIEVMGSGAIPVIIADGLTLPFEQLINYTNACIWVKEIVVNNAKDLGFLLAALPSDPDLIKTMRTNSLEIYRKFFESDTTISDMLLLCTAIEKFNIREHNKCSRKNCPYEKHAEISNNGGTHCCFNCKIDKGHGVLCVKDRLLKTKTTA